MKKITKKRVFDIIQIGFDEDWQSRIFDIGLMTMILINLFIALFSTFDEAKPYMMTMETIEYITVVAFAIEYCLRVWTAEYLYPQKTKGRAVRSYITSFNGVIDLLAFLPSFLPVFFPMGAVAFRMFRVVRIFRLFRVNAYYDALNVIGEVIINKKNQILSSVFIIVVLMTASSLCMYSLEHNAQPEVFKNAFSGFWWSVSTLLTVGYGDIYPITFLGRAFGIVISFLGVGLVAIPTGIISAGFVEQYTKLQNVSNDAENVVSGVASNSNSVGGEIPGETSVHFVSIKLTADHPWTGLQIQQLDISRGLILTAIEREGQILMPEREVSLRQHDKVYLVQK